MSTNNEYSRRQGSAHRPRRNIEFFDPDFDADTTPSHEDYYPRRNNARDDRDYDYDDRDYDDRSYEDDRGYDDRDYNDGTYEDNSYDNEAYDDSGYDDSGTTTSRMTTSDTTPPTLPASRSPLTAIPSPLTANRSRRPATPTRVTTQATATVSATTKPAPPILPGGATALFPPKAIKIWTTRNPAALSAATPF